jgi:hypothetical protein
VSGHCTQYVAPGANLPFEMVELSAEARQGDSGGPIFNERGELAGVLFGASQGTTSGSYCGRVSAFLAAFLNGAAVDSNQLAGNIPPGGTRNVNAGDAANPPGPTFGAPAAPSAHDVSPLPPAPSQPVGAGAFARVEPYFGTSPRLTAPVDLAPPRDVSSFSAPVFRHGTQLGGDAWSESTAGESLLVSAKKPAAAPWEEFVGNTPLELGKSILAGIGILAVLMRLSNALAGGRD